MSNKNVHQNGPPIQRVVKKEKSTFDVSKFQEIYEFDTTLPGTGIPVRFRPLKTGQIKKMLAYENEKDPLALSKMMNMVITEAVINKDDFDINDILIKDRAFLLWEMRNKTKGNMWETEYKCEKCGSQNLLVKDLSKFPIKKIDFVNTNYIIDVFEDVKIQMRFLKVSDELEALTFIDNKMSDMQKQAEITIILHSAGIDKIIKGDEEYTDLQLIDKKFFVEEMPTVVYEKISQWYKDNDYGTNFTIKNSCITCGNEIEFEATPDNFFF